MRRHLFASATLCLLLTGCDQIAVPGASQPDEPATPDAPIFEAAEAQEEILETAEPINSAMVKATIDWDAARADLARRNATARSFGEEEPSLQIQSADGEPAPVPILLPTGIVSIQRSGPGPSIRQTEDGYFARYPGVAYDVVVHGTNEIAAADSDIVIRNEDLEFVDLMDGAQVSLSRYGADYLVSFDCKAAQGGMDNCITEEEALEVARGLIIAGSR